MNRGNNGNNQNPLQRSNQAVEEQRQANTGGWGLGAAVGLAVGVLGQVGTALANSTVSGLTSAGMNSTDISNVSVPTTVAGIVTGNGMNSTVASESKGFPNLLHLALGFFGLLSLGSWVLAIYDLSKGSSGRGNGRNGDDIELGAIGGGNGDSESIYGTPYTTPFTTPGGSEESLYATPPTTPVDAELVSLNGGDRGQGHRPSLRDELGRNSGRGGSKHTGDKVTKFSMAR